MSDSDVSRQNWWNWRKLNYMAIRYRWKNLRRILRPWLRMPEPPDTVVLGVRISLITDELLQVLPEGTRLVDSGAAIARRTARLLEHYEAPDAKSTGCR